jgi:hypothetical protein
LYLQTASAQTQRCAVNRRLPIEVGNDMCDLEHEREVPGQDVTRNVWGDKIDHLLKLIR